jgi:restriction system protein
VPSIAIIIKNLLHDIFLLFYNIFCSLGKYFSNLFAKILRVGYNIVMKKSSGLVFIKRFFFFLLMIVLTPVLVVEAIVKAIMRAKRKKSWEKKELEGQKVLLSSSITDIDLMEGYMFEDYLKILLFYCGYNVQTTQKSRDYGCDLIATDPETNQKIVIQAKRYSKPVGSHAVQEIASAVTHYKADEAWVITNNVFTPQAEQLAKETQVRLIDRQELIEMYTRVCQSLSVDNNDSTLISQTSLADKYPFMI